MHGEVCGSGYGIDGKEDGDQDEEGVTADWADEILKELPHFVEVELVTAKENFFFIFLFSCRLRQRFNIDLNLSLWIIECLNNHESFVPKFSYKTWD